MYWGGKTTVNCFSGLSYWSLLYIGGVGMRRDQRGKGVGEGGFDVLFPSADRLDVGNSTSIRFAHSIAVQPHGAGLETTLPRTYSDQSFSKYLTLTPSGRSSSGVWMTECEAGW